MIDNWATPLQAPFQDSFSKEGNRFFFKPFVKATLSRVANLLLQSKAGGIFFPKFWRAVRWWTLVTALKSYLPPRGHQMIVIVLEDKKNHFASNEPIKWTGAWAPGVAKRLSSLIGSKINDRSRVRFLTGAGALSSSSFHSHFVTTLAIK